MPHNCMGALFLIGQPTLRRSTKHPIVCVVWKPAELSSPPKYLCRETSSQPKPGRDSGSLAEFAEPLRREYSGIPVPGHRPFFLEITKPFYPPASHLGGSLALDSSSVSDCPPRAPRHSRPWKNRFPRFLSTHPQTNGGTESVRRLEFQDIHDRDQVPWPACSGNIPLCRMSHDSKDHIISTSWIRPSAQRLHGAIRDAEHVLAPPHPHSSHPHVLRCTRHDQGIRRHRGSPHSVFYWPRSTSRKSKLYAAFSPV
jgi:hypothetical protein